MAFVSLCGSRWLSCRGVARAVRVASWRQSLVPSAREELGEKTRQSCPLLTPETRPVLQAALPGLLGATPVGRTSPPAQGRPFLGAARLSLSTAAHAAPSGTGGQGQAGRCLVQVPQGDTTATKTPTPPGCASRQTSASLLPLPQGSPLFLHRNLKSCSCNAPFMSDSSPSFIVLNLPLNSRLTVPVTYVTPGSSQRPK